MSTIAIVLAGGASRRMGVDKLALARNPADGGSTLFHVVRVAADVADKVVVMDGVDCPHRFAHTKTSFVADLDVHLGPVPAFARAFAGLTEDVEAVFLLAGDLPGIVPEVLQTLHRFLGSRSLDVAGVCAKRDGRIQPLVGCYRQRIGKSLQRAHAMGEMRLMVALQGERLESIQSCQGDWPLWWTKPVHTREDYIDWLRHWEETKQ